MRSVIGIDPGLDGGIAIIQLDGVLLHEVPTVSFEQKTTRGGKSVMANKREYDLAAMRVILDGHQQQGFVVIEKSQAFPSQGGVSNFSSGFGFGAWRGLLVGLGFRYEMVPPATWKRDLGLGKDKSQSFLLAKQLFPETANSYRVPKGRKDTLDGLAEALLLAEWMRRRLGREAVA